MRVPLGALCKVRPRSLSTAEKFRDRLGSGTLCGRFTHRLGSLLPPANTCRSFIASPLRARCITTNRTRIPDEPFYEGRFNSIAVLDEEALLAVCAYIDLNSVAAGMALTPETSEHTS